MAIAVPARRSSLQTAPPRTAPPEPKKRPRDRPRPGGPGRSSTAAPSALRKEPKSRTAAPSRQKAAPKRKKATATRASAATSPIRKTTPQRKKASPTRAGTTSPARKAARNLLVTAPSRHKVSPRRRARVIPIAAGRAAVAVSQLPESGLIHRLTRGRAWIGLLGVLLVGIVALNVVTLSFAASSGKVEERNSTLSKENSVMQSKNATAYGQAKMRNEAKEAGLSLPTEVAPQMITARSTDVPEAAARLAALAAAASASSSPE
jgi:hypothetical protein